MNFIKLLFKLKLENENFSKYSDADFIKLKKLIKVERQINSEISSDISNKLLEVIHKNPNELNQFLKRKGLVNIFLNKKYEINYDTLFPKPNFKSFFNKYFEDDLSYIFKRKISKKDYGSLEKLIKFKNFFSDDFLYNLQEIFENKLLNANNFFYQNGFIYHYEYSFLEDNDFFYFINSINNFTIEDELSTIYNLAIDKINENIKEKYSSNSIIAFSVYMPYDDEFRLLVKQNKNFAKARLKELSRGVLEKIFRVLGVILKYLLYILLIAILFGRSIGGVVIIIALIVRYVRKK